MHLGPRLSGGGKMRTLRVLILALVCADVEEGPDPSGVPDAERCAAERPAGVPAPSRAGPRAAVLLETRALPSLVPVVPKSDSERSCVRGQGSMSRVVRRRRQ